MSLIMKDCNIKTKGKFEAKYQNNYATHTSRKFHFQSSMDAKGHFSQMHHTTYIIKMQLLR